MEIKILTDTQKYQIANNVARLYNFTSSYLSDKCNRDKALGVIINTPDSSGKTLQQVFGKDQALHITNLVFRKLNQRNNQLSVSFDSLVK